MFLCFFIMHSLGHFQRFPPLLYSTTLLDLWSTWGSLFGMLLKAGDRVWNIGADICNNIEDIDKDPFCKYKASDDKDDHSEVPLILMESSAEKTCANETNNEMKDKCVENESMLPFPSDADGSINATVANFASKEAHTTTDLLDFLYQYGAGLGPSLHSAKLYSNSGNKDKKKRKKKTSNEPDMNWMDPTLTPLPYAPNLKIYCFYGVGLETERNYFYKVNRESTPEEGKYDLELPFVLDTSIDDPERKILHGIRFTDGDGSVPLLSLGYTCHDVWNRKDSGMNPSGSKVVTVEYANRAVFSVDDPMRGGPHSADHVDILGNVEMTEDFLRVVADLKPRTESRIVSNLEEIVKEINAHPKGGVFKRK